MAKYLDSTGLSVLWNKIKNKLIPATTTEAGLMSANDKKLINSLDNLINNSNLPDILNNIDSYVFEINTNEYSIPNRDSILPLFYMKSSLPGGDSYVNQVDLQAATTIEAGVMSSTDKSNLDNVVAELPNKADTTDLPNIIGESVVDGDTFEGFDNLTREELKKDLFDDLWLKAVGEYGSIDKTHKENNVIKPYYLNTLWFSYDEALAIYTAGSINSKSISAKYAGFKIKTNLPMTISGYSSSSSNPAFDNPKNIIQGSDIEILNISSLSKGGNNCFTIGAISGTDTVFNGNLLKKIIGIIQLGVNGANWAFNNVFITPNLEEVKILNLTRNLDIRKCSKLNLASFQYMIQYANNYTTKTLTVHPDVYAKLTDESNTEWNNLLTLAATKNITFATTN